MYIISIVCVSICFTIHLQLVMYFSKICVFFALVVCWCLTTPSSLALLRVIITLAQWYCKWLSTAVRCFYFAGKIRGTAALFLFSRFCPFLLFVLCACHSDSALSFLGWLKIVWLQSNNGNRVSFTILVRISVYTHPC